MTTTMVVLPGDVLNVAPKGNDAVLEIGTGLKVASTESSSKIVATRCGIVRRQTVGDGVWLDYRLKRYVPVMEDYVVGEIVQKSSENFKVDFGAADLANLPALSFEGATKRNKPNIKIGDLVYGRLVQTVEPELSCVGRDGVARCLGALPAGGFLTRQNSNVVCKLLSPDFPLLPTLGKEIPHEICVGLNGWIWIKAHKVKETILIVNAVEACEYFKNDDVRTTVKQMLDKVRGF